MTNKTIYITYKHDYLPNKVFNNWKKYNPEYEINFSKDIDCYEFLNKHFNQEIVNYFHTLAYGAWKADLWRLCKLYIHSGIYSDVDIEPFIKLDTLDKDITFYSSLTTINPKTIFQAFITNFSQPKNPLILACLVYFLQHIDNKNSIWTWPTYNMYELIKYNLNIDKIQPFIKYNIDIVKIPIQIGISNQNKKLINLHYFPDIEYSVLLEKNPYNDTFHFEITNNILEVTRTDSTMGWGHNHRCYIAISSKEVLYFFLEISNPNRVVDNHEHILFKSKYSDYPWNIESFPKTIYMCDKTLDTINIHSHNWKQLNPTYTIKLYDDAICEQFLEKSFSSLHKHIFKIISYGPYKADFWRLCILYKYGGIYVDSDIEPLVPLDTYIEKTIDLATCIIDYNYSGNKHVDNLLQYFKQFPFIFYNPHFIIAKKNNNIIKECIDQYIYNYTHKINISWQNYSIVPIMSRILHKYLQTNKEGIYNIKNMKIQLLSNVYENGKINEHAKYRGIRVFNNRYGIYKEKVM